MKDLKIIYKYDRPYGIRNDGGFLFFFVDIPKYPCQEKRYRQELADQQEMADYLLNVLKHKDDFDIDIIKEEYKKIEKSLEKISMPKTI